MCKTTTTVNRLSQFEQADPLRRSPELLALTVAVVKSEGHRKAIAILRMAKRLQEAIDSLIEDHGPDTDSALSQYLDANDSGGMWEDLSALRYNAGIGADMVSCVLPGVPAGL